METIVAENSRIAKNQKSNVHFVFFLICLTFLSAFSIHFLLPPEIRGDGVSYAQSMAVLSGAPLPADFTPNRLLTTFLGLESVIVLSKIFGGIMTAWIMLNLFFYFLLNIIFYKLVQSLFQSEKVAFIGGVFMAANYALLVFGLNYLMDIGGWAFYMLSIFFTWKYVQSGQRKHILFASLAAGIGGLFKEYALLAIISLAFFIIYDNRHSLFGLFKKSLVPAFLALFPLALVYVFIYVRFHYTYADWFLANKTEYVYRSRIIEYVKSLGVLVNVLAFFVLGGLAVLFKQWKAVDTRIKLYVVSISMSVLPIFLWPAITERILFITVPVGIIIGCFFFKKYERYWYLFLIPLILYACASFFMDSFVLKFINLPF